MPHTRKLPAVGLGFFVERVTRMQPALSLGSPADRDRRPSSDDPPDVTTGWGSALLRSLLAARRLEPAAVHLRTGCAVWATKKLSGPV